MPRAGPILSIAFLTMTVLTYYLLPQVPRALRLLIAWQCLLWPYLLTYLLVLPAPGASCTAPTLRPLTLAIPTMPARCPRCLVHCAAGINRSGFIAGAELLLHTRLPLLEVVARLRAARGVAMHA